MAVLELQNVGKAFGAVWAVEDASFTVAKGEIVALLGPSGCGKTTTLRLIAGFETPDRGRIFMNGQDVALKRPYERSIGLVFQDYALFPHMTVAENIAFGMKHRGVKRSEIPARTAQVLERVKLPGLENRRPNQLSGGQQQRVALARALVTQPDVMLLDEPLSNLDAKLRHHLRLELRQILSGAGRTSIIVTHDQSEAMSLADRIILMNAGRIEQIDTPAGLYARPRTRFSADFIGQANWFDGVMHGGRVASKVGAIAVPIAEDGLSEGAPVSVCVRPERIAVLANGHGEAEYPTRIAGRLEAVEHLGSDLSLWVRIATGDLVQAVVKNAGAAPPEAGSDVILAFRPEDCILLPRKEAPA
jgi:putative spermidine/putrescine transport system ATP-binding protein/putrescine transport system ATP-binding protein